MVDMVQTRYLSAYVLCHFTVKEILQPSNPYNRENPRKHPLHACMLTLYRSYFDPVHREKKKKHNYY